MSTQWRYERGLRTGLDYKALDSVYSGLGIKKKAIRDVFHKIRVMEIEALEAFNEATQDS